MTGLILWLAAGVVVGISGRLLLPGPSLPWLPALGAGIVGALLGGAAASLMDMGGIAELNVRSGVLSFLAALLVVILLQLVRARRA
jgi:uncharacterized membrane protein YeaQ/YmgE (transglycosylase-associated protein family)